ncbi:uncharacterized protein EAF02_010542 [Botrytis sinoallii]|uniref:uncharacterized protein n=1 Tax=Botrytis sinoallii TaxID=1463999 RepID=UPI0019002591|nr:uncharacterized protein EAF02_010542 [Botrytis sinoallii]KAF7861588.1 hypothetical protein EAF02_010542 [Botrytis sinoallii]
MFAQAVDQATSVTEESKKAAIEQLNKEGNVLFGCKKLSEVVQFECGRYTECIKGVEDILELMDVQQLDDKIVISNLQRQLKRAYDHVPTSSLQEQLQRRLKIFACFPRDRASMFTSPECFRIGNDVAEPLSVEVPKDSLKKGDIISFFFAGIGDARHLYATIIDLHESGNRTTATPRKYHFVANDLNICSLTRNLIIWTLLDELSALDHGSDQGLMVLTTIFSIYRPIIMPGYVYKLLCTTMEAILAKLDKGVSPVEWVTLHGYDIPRYIDVLKHWASNGFGIFTTEKVIQGTRDKLSQQSLLHDSRDISKVCTEEKEFYANYALVYPPEKIILSQEPRLKKLITKALDYIGGHLSTFLYVVPLLKIGRSSYLKSNCLRNPGSWDCLEAFLADYQCITDKEMLRELRGVVAALEPGKDELLPLIKYNSYSREALDFTGCLVRIVTSG